MKLKLGLLGSILDNVQTSNKYSKAFINLQNVFELETKENFKFSKKFLEDFTQIKLKYYDFINGVPLQVIEKFYFQNHDKLNKYVYIEFEEKEVEDVKTIDLFLMLENYFNEIFALSCEIADFYNLEVKINNKSTSENFI